jgi:hypothetical protein
MTDARANTGAEVGFARHSPRAGGADRDFGCAVSIAATRPCEFDAVAEVVTGGGSVSGPGYASACRGG